MGGEGKTLGVALLVLMFLEACLAPSFAVSDEIENIKNNPKKCMCKL